MYIFDQVVDYVVHLLPSLPAKGEKWIVLIAHVMQSPFLILGDHWIELWW